LIGRTASWLSQVENGKGSLVAEDLGKLLDFYGARGKERETILALGAAARRHGGTAARRPAGICRQPPGSLPAPG
jgi:hypothetical protein